LIVADQIKVLKKRLRQMERDEIMQMERDYEEG
jgi:hypothetical protein